MKSPLFRHRFALVALLLLPTFAGCSTSSFTAQQRRLASVDLIVAKPAPRPVAKPGEDLGVIASRAYAWGAENARRLLESRCAYDDQAAQLASGGKTKRSVLAECVALRKRAVA